MPLYLPPFYTQRLTSTQRKIVLASEFIWAIATTLVKFSILSLYLEIFRGKLFRASCYTIGALSLALAAAMFLIAGLLCQPIEKNWDPLMTTGHCGDSVKMDVATATINMILDLFIVILPLPSLWKLQMSWTRKAMLSGIFSLGLVYASLPTVLHFKKLKTDPLCLS